MVLLCIDQTCFCFHSMAASKQMDKFHFYGISIRVTGQGFRGDAETACKCVFNLFSSNNFAVSILAMTSLPYAF